MSTATNHPYGVMETEFRAKREAGRKLLVPYLTGGYSGWQDAIRAAAAAGADAIEIGIPFSDPVMDGPIIQQASQAALESGATPVSILHDARSLDVSIPLAVMTYYNTVHHAGHARFAAQLADAGIVAAIVPDLPLEEAGPWCEAADAAGIETVMLAAPTAPDVHVHTILGQLLHVVREPLGIQPRQEHHRNPHVHLHQRLVRNSSPIPTSATSAMRIGTPPRLVTMIDLRSSMPEA